MRAFFVIYLAACVQIAQAGVLWGKAESGASLDEIAKLYPEGRRIVPTEKQRMANGATLGYEAPNVSVRGADFKVAFYFLQGTLDTVGLSHKSQEGAHGCGLTFESLREGLRAKYGQELSAKGSHRIAAMRSAVWQHQQTTIQLNMIAFDPDDCNIYLNYGSGLAKASENL